MSHNRNTSPSTPCNPSQLGEKGKRTYEKVLKAAQDILEEDGIEALSSNAIVKRAGVSIPVFYRYFKDKYALLAVLGNRLTEAQDVVYRRAVEHPPAADYDAIYAHSLKTLRDIFSVTEKFVGARALLIALRAIPRLSFLRLEAADIAAKMTIDHVCAVLPHVSREEAYDRTRLTLEMGYATIEMLLEIDGVSRESVFEHTAAATAHVMLR